METPTNTYYFRDGQMVPYVLDEVFPRSEKESDKDYFTHLGFEHSYSKIEMLTWCRRSSGQGPDYLARWYDYDNSDFAWIFVHSWPDLLKLRILLAPILQTHYQQQTAAIAAERWAAERRK